MEESSSGEEQQHPVFTRDPAEWMAYLNKEVLLLTEKGTEHRGWVYTIDPVSQTIALIQFENGQYMLELVMGHAVKSISVLNDNTELHKEQLDSLFKPTLHKMISPEELKERKQNLMSWLLKNRIPVDVSGMDSEIISVSDALFIEPPYTAENCRSTNEIILGRIQGLIKNMPKDLDWNE